MRRRLVHSLRQIVSQYRKGTSNYFAPHSRRLLLEPLEDRRLLAFDVTGWTEPVPAWAEQDFVECTGGYTGDGFDIDVFIADLDEGFNTPSDWKVETGFLDDPLIDLSDLRTGYKAGLTFSIFRPDLGEPITSNTGYRLLAEVLGQPIFDQTLYTNAGIGYRAGKFSADASVEFYPEFDRGLEWEMNTASVDFHAHYEKKLPLAKATIPVASVPGLSINFALSAGMVLDFEGEVDISFDGEDLELSYAHFHPDVELMLQGTAEAAAFVEVAKAGVNLRGNFDQEFTVQYDADTSGEWDFDGPGRFWIDGEFFAKVPFLKEFKFGAFEFDPITWNWAGPEEPANIPDVPAPTESEYVPFLVSIQGDNNAALSSTLANARQHPFPTFSVMANVGDGHLAATRGYEFTTWRQVGDQWVDETSWGACDKADVLGEFSGGTYMIMAQATSTEGLVSYSEPYFIIIDTPEPGTALSVDDVIWDDLRDDRDDVLEEWERGEIRIRLRSEEDVTNAVGTLSTPYDVVDVYDDKNWYNTINEGNRSYGIGEYKAEFNLGSDPGNPDTIDVPFVLHTTYTMDGQKYFQDLDLDVLLRPQDDYGSFEVTGYLIDGNLDGVFHEPGHTDEVLHSGMKAKIKPLLAYEGLARATDVTAHMHYNGDGVIVRESGQRYPAIDPGDDEYPEDGEAFTVVADRGFVGSLSLDMELTWDQGDKPWQMTDVLTVDVAPAPWLHLSEEAWDFRSLVPGQPLQRDGEPFTFMVSNTGTDALQVSEIVTRDGTGNTVTNTYALPVVASDAPWTIASGESLEFVVTIEHTDQLRGMITRDIHVVSDGFTNAPDRDEHVILTGFIGHSVPIFEVPFENAHKPDIFGSWIVWNNDLKGVVYAYNTSTDEIITVTDETAAAPSNPQIGEAFIVWEDLEAGQQDIYAFDRFTGEVFPITLDSADERLIGIHGQKVAFLRQYYESVSQNVEGYGVWIYDIASDTEQEVTSFVASSNEAVLTIGAADFGGGILAWSETDARGLDATVDATLKYEPGIDTAPILLSDAKATRIACNDGTVVWRELRSDTKTTMLDCLQDTWVELTDDYGPTGDTNNHGTDTKLKVFYGLDSEGSHFTEVAFLEFDMSSMADFNTLISADLNFWVDRHGTSAAIEIQYPSEDWNEVTVTSESYSTFPKFLPLEPRPKDFVDDGWNAFPLPDDQLDEMFQNIVNREGTIDVVLKPYQVFVDREIEMSDYVRIAPRQDADQSPYLEVTYTTNQYEAWKIFESGEDNATNLLLPGSYPPSLYWTHFASDFVAYEKYQGDEIWYRRLGDPAEEHLLTDLVGTTDDGRMDGIGVVWHEVATHKVYYAFLEQPEIGVGDIEAEVANPQEGDLIQVTAIVQNVTPFNKAGTIEARLYDGDPDDPTTQMLGSAIAFDGLAGEQQMSVTWDDITIPDNPAAEDIMVRSLFVEITVPGIDDFSDNLASTPITVHDDDILPPTVSGFQVAEHEGDGDGMIGSDEQLRVSWTATDPNGIATEMLLLDSDGDGPLEPQVVGGGSPLSLDALPAGDYQLILRMGDGDNSPETVEQTLSFSVVDEEMAVFLFEGRLISDGQAIDAGSLPVDSQAEIFWLVRNDGDQTLALATPDLDVREGAATLQPLTVDTLPAGSTGYLSMLIDTSEPGPFEGTLALDGESLEITVSGDVVEVAIRATPDLISASDTGKLEDDNITRLDNSAVNAELQFSIGGTKTDAVVRLYADGTLIGSANATGETTVVVTDGTHELVDGSHLITATQQEPGEDESEHSDSLTITIDTQVPTVSVPDLDSLSDTGVSDSDNITQGMAPGFAGAADDGGSGVWKVEVLVDGVVRQVDGSLPFYGVTLDTLDEGERQITAKAYDVAGNVTSSTSLPVRVDRTGATVSLTVPAVTSDTTPNVQVAATDQNGLPDGTAVRLDVDLNNDGDFSDTGELGYTSATLVNGAASFDVMPTLPEGTYRIQAHVVDVVGNEGVSTVETTQITTTSLQIVSGSTSTVRATAGDSFPVTVEYTTSDDDSTLTGLGLRMHYDSSVLTFNGFREVLEPVFQQQGPVEDTDDFDGDANTDKYIHISWVDMAGNWPNETLPVDLFDSCFTLAETATEETTTTIRFSASSSAATHGFVGNPITVTVRTVDLDVDDNGLIEDAYDGVLIMRHLFGFSGTALTAGAIGSDAVRTDPAVIAAFLDNGLDSMLDPDASGSADALSDGILIRRYMSGWEDGIDDALPPAATRRDWDEIKDFLETFLPTTCDTGSLVEPLTMSTLSDMPDELVSVEVAEQSGEAAAAADTEVVREPVLTSSTSTAEAVSIGTQAILPEPSVVTTSSGQTVSFNVGYTTDPPVPTLTGLGLRMHYDSSVLAFDSVSGVLGDGFEQQQAPVDDVDDFDSDDRTDKYILLAWDDDAGEWPGEISVQLFVSDYLATAAEGSTSINFSSAATAAGWALDATSATVTILSGDTSVAGHIYAINEDPRFQPARLPLLNVVVNLLAMDSEEVVASTRTDATGSYQFEDLSSGTYSVTRVQPGCILDGGAGEVTVEVGASDGNADNDLSENWLRPEYISCGMFLASTVNSPYCGWDVGLAEKIERSTPTEDVEAEEADSASATMEVEEGAFSISDAEETVAVAEVAVVAVSSEEGTKQVTEDQAVDDPALSEQPLAATTSEAVASERLEVIQAGEPTAPSVPVQESAAETFVEVSEPGLQPESAAVTSAVSEPELSPVACVNQPDSPAMQESRHAEILASDSSVGKEFANEEDLGETFSSFGNSIQLVQTECSLPDDLEVSVRFRSEPNTASRWANALVLIDYHNESDYKFAGAFTGTNQWAIGRMTERGYVIETQLCEEIDGGTGHEMQIALEGDRVTVIADGEVKVSHSFDDVSNQRPLGLSSYLATNRFDGFSVTGLSADEDSLIDAELPG